jgi:two-component system, sensor histidine kinase and response regulator
MKKILLIDDEADFVDATKLLLEGNGYSVIAAFDGLTGLRLAKSEQPDLILCDLVMSPVDGFMTLSILRQQADTAVIPFAIISGKREVEAVRKGMLLGADEYISKPFTADELLESIENLLAARGVALIESGVLIRDLKTQLGAPMEPHVIESMDRLLDCADKLEGAVGGEATETAAGHRRQIAAELEVLTRAIANARLLAQIEKVAANADAVRILPGAESAQIQAIIRAEFGRHDRSDRIRFDVEDATVRLGPLCLSRIFDELARNAVHYSPRDAEITVRGRLLDQSVQVDIANESISDFSGNTTIQMRREDFDAVLPPEFSHGLGLKVAHNLVALHGGSLTIRRPGVRQVLLHLNLPA